MTGFIHIFAVVLAFAIPVAAVAQSGDTLKTKDVIITKDYAPAISDAVKLSENPEFQQIDVPVPELTYSMLKKQIKTDFEVEPIQAAKMKGEPLNKLYKSYIKLGLGNYTTTYLDAYVNNSRSRQHSIGAHYRHHASAGRLKGVGYSGFSDNELDLYGKKFLKKHLLSGGLDFSRNVVHFYGYDPLDFANLDKDNTRQRFSRIGGNAGLMSFYRDSTKLNHKIVLNYYHLADLYSASENNLLLETNLSKYYSKELLKLNVVFDYNNYIPGSIQPLNIAPPPLNNAIAKLNPQIVSSGKQWRLDAGMRIFVESETYTRFHFYPDAHFKYNVVGNLLIPYVGITGGIKRNNFKSFTTENPYLLPNIEMRNSNRKYEMYGGIRGTMGADISFNTRASKSKIVNMPLYVNVPQENQFEVIYDTVAVVNVSGEVTYRKTEKLSLLLRGDYSNYNMTEELAPWHLPAFRITIGGVYDLKDKIVVRGEVFALSNQLARSYNPADGDNLGYGVYGKKLKGTVDVNIGVEYRYTNKLSAFINFNNLAGIRHFRWNNYPSQRFQALGGIAYSFWSK